MNFKLAFTFFFMSALTAMEAQTKKISTADGNWSATAYAANVVKLVFQPANYLAGENITGAVITKPMAKTVTSITVKDDALIVGDSKKITIAAVLNKDGNNGFKFLLGEGEKIFGGGERALPLNRRGYKFNLYNNPWYGYGEGADNLNFSVPFFTSSNGYGLFFDNASKGYADIGKSDANIFEAAFSSGELNVYIITGKDYKEILSSYHKLTGTQPLPPRWAMGNFQSRFGYTSQAQAIEINDKMSSEKIPHDAIIFDLFWFGDSIKHTLGNLEWVNKSRWPDPVKMMTGFRKKNVNTILIAEPFILEGTRQYENAQPFLATDSLGKGGLLDIFRKDAGDWIWKTHYKKQIGNGVAGWWTDLGEPEKHPKLIRHNLKDLGFKRSFGADEVHNVYGQYWNKMLFENYAREYPGTRLFHLNRSGFSGSQRYSIFPWSGDVSRSWSGLRAQLPVMLGMSMSGIPYIHADAGGFAGGEGDNELYVRWLQFASFTPIFRPHGTALYEVDKNAFSFPSEPALIAEPYRSYAKEVIRMRYAMLPYNYTLAYRQATKGEPLVAPLYYHFPADTAAYTIGDEFMWGENILVAPVLEKDTNNITRKIYLPRGSWYAFDGTAPIEGGRHISAPVVINKMFTYVKAGSIIATSAKVNAANTMEDDNSDLWVHYYHDNQPSSAVIYEDDGITKQALSRNQYQLITFTALPAAAKTIFTVKSTGAGFKGMPAKRKITFMVHGPANPKNNLYINGKFAKRLSYKTDDAASRDNVYFFTVDFDGKPLKLEIK
jgi:oligosaccharide 4-alpha-D-glucosyltransferase